MIELRKGVAYVGLLDVVGGKMWFCHDPNHQCSAVFWTKKECEGFIRDTFDKEDRKQLLARLKSVKGRAFRYV